MKILIDTKISVAANPRQEKKNNHQNRVVSSLSRYAPHRNFAILQVHIFNMHINCVFCPHELCLCTPIFACDFIFVHNDC